MSSMAEWEVIKPGSFGRNPYGNQWKTVAAVAINKGGITLNSAFVERFVGRSTMCLLFSREGMIGIKMIAPGEEVPDAFPIVNNNNKQTTKAKKVACSRFTKALTDCIGRAYRAEMHPNGRIIQVELSPDNKLK